MDKKLLFFENRYFQLIIISLIALLLYGNTLYNQYALDDGMVILENKFVTQGISGIPDIITHDSFYGAIGNSKNLSGGRYRPLSLIAFAIENTLFGNNAFVHHFFNLLFYVCTCIVLLLFLRKFIFKQYPAAAFIAALLFTVHPIHTEAVANIKSRDEVMSLFFLLLTLYYLLEFITVSKKQIHIFLSVVFFALALLSKENGIIFIGIIPVTLYFFSLKRVSEITLQSIPYWGVAALYFLLRSSVLVVNHKEITEVMDNPYVLASLADKYATMLYVLLRYVQLLFWPHPLSYDYSYKQIPYQDFSSIGVWFAVLLHLLMIVIIIYGLRKKDLLSWCLLFYLSGMFIISNLLINIGAPMAERFLFQATVPFSILLTEIGRRLWLRWKTAETVKMLSVALLLIPVTIVSSYATINRNTDWQSNETLFLHDVKVASGSARANTYAGVAMIKLSDGAKNDTLKRSYAEQALAYFKIADSIKKDYITTLLNMGVVYSRLDSVDAAEEVWSRARNVDPGNSNFLLYDKYLAESYYQRGMEEARNKNLSNCISYLDKAVLYDPKNADAWYNLGGACFTLGQFGKAKECWQKTLQINPNHQDAANGLKALSMILK
ncbi:MAG: tetratricopeptide repeat protein [Chitinophagaceae bacterium]|nr:tetratricopeptide repeat protein [Chitinophagaceae bacterium]